jgi:hypothetical protein
MQSSAIGILIAVGTAAAGSPVCDEGVEVFVDYYNAATSGPLMLTAQSYTSRLLADAGVRIVWRSGAPASGASELPRVHMTFVAIAPPEFRAKPKALGAAAPFGAGVRRITIFSDRLARFVQPLRVRTGAVVGHIFAHELVHILQGAAAHSDRGLMRENWTREDLDTMSRHGLPMTGFDREFVRLGISAWRARLTLEKTHRREDFVQPRSTATGSLAAILLHNQHQ